MAVSPRHLGSQYCDNQGWIVLPLVVLGVDWEINSQLVLCVIAAWECCGDRAERGNAGRKASKEHSRIQHVAQEAELR